MTIKLNDTSAVPSGLSLPSDFLHGFATAAYQIEGGYDQDGKGLGVWDVVLANRDNGNEACNSYNLWREDVALLKSLGANSYRFSISWARVIPNGGRNDPVNPKGIEYYSNLIDALLEAGITPLVTLFHFDPPQELEKRYKGWRATGPGREELVLDFERYARVCFEAFGDRVKHWLTHNEPLVFIMLHMDLPDGLDVDTERWEIGKNLLLTHAHAVAAYRKEFQSSQGGKIGITLNIEWVEPFDDSVEARKAANRALDLMAGWFADPIYLGRVNPTVARLAPKSAMEFTEDEWSLLHGSSDFFGVNHYSTRLATGKILDRASTIEALFGGIEYVTERDGVDIGNRGHNGHPYDVPWGFHKLLHYIHQTWTSTSARPGPAVPIFVTENGFASQGELEFSLDRALDDQDRVDYFTGYLDALARAVNEGVPVQAYFAWSLMDNLEWTVGYEPCFGVTHVDRTGGTYARTAKRSAWYIKSFFEQATAHARV